MSLVGKISICIIILITGFAKTWQNKDESPDAVTHILPPVQVFSRICVLSIHVSDTIIHDSVFHFLSDQLGLPVEYFPVKLGNRRYAGVYAGNMFLEPCGPFKDFRYARDPFKAVFYGLNCETELSLSSLAEDLREKKIKFRQDSSIVIIDSLITRQKMYFGISHRKVFAKIKGRDEIALDSLNEVMKYKCYNSSGIIGIKEVWIGFDADTIINKWIDLIKPGYISNTGLWKINNDQSIRFIKSDMTEVKAIVFKVSSLEMARQYLSEKRLSGKSERDIIEIDPVKSYGLKIYLSEK